jgi:hypothetical protein
MLATTSITHTAAAAASRKKCKRVQEGKISPKDATATVPDLLVGPAVFNYTPQHNKDGTTISQRLGHLLCRQQTHSASLHCATSTS